MLIWPSVWLSLKNMPELILFKYCRDCGEKIATSAAVCPHCGGAQLNVGLATVPMAKSRVTAAILALFLGGIGVHKFYLGHTGMGILYLFFSWTCIPAMIAVVEGIIMLTQSDDEFAMKNLSK